VLRYDNCHYRSVRSGGDVVRSFLIWNLVRENISSHFPSKLDSQLLPCMHLIPFREILRNIFCETINKVRPCLFYLLDYGIAALQKPKSEKKKKFHTIIFHLRFFSCHWFVSPIKKCFSVDHIGRAYKSTWSIKMFCCFTTGNVVLRSPGL
jgi:hypothetical protein